MTAILKNKNLYVPANQLVTSDDVGREKVQRLNSDWNRMLVEYFTYFSPSVIVIADFDARDYFQVGDIIHLIQGGSEKYFYIFDISETTISIDGGSLYSFTNDAITVIEHSRLTNPFGFPGKLPFTPTCIFTSGGTNSLDTSTLEYKMIGNLIHVRGRLYYNLDALFSGVIENTYPFPLRDPESTYEGMNLQPYESPTPDLYNLAFGRNANLGAGRELTHFLMSGTYGSIVGSGIPTQMFECNFDYYQ